MSTTRVVLAAAAVAALVVLLLRQTPPGASARPADASPPRAAAAAPRATAAPARPTRDVFQYVENVRPPVEEKGAPAPRAVATPLPPPEPLAAATPDPLAPRLIGLVRKGGSLEAMVAVEGEVMVVKKGSRAGGYTVTDIDEDRGVRLQDAGGTALVLAPPPS